MSSSSRIAWHLADVTVYGARMPNSFHDVASAGFTLGSDHRGAFTDTTQGFPEVAAAADKGDLEVVLEDVIGFVRRCQDFRIRQCSRPQAPQGSELRQNDRCGILP